MDCLHVCHADERPHGEGEERDEEEVACGGDGVETVAEAPDFCSDGFGDGRGERMQQGVGETGDGLAGNAEDDGEDGDGGGPGERKEAGVDEDIAMRHVTGNEEQGGGEDDGGGAEVEHALDGVDRELRADGEADFFGDERGAGDVGEAAEERDGGKADELRADEREGRDFFRRRDEDGPARRAQPVGGVDERNAGGDTRPGDVMKLLAEGDPVELDFAAIGEDDDCEDQRQREDEEGLAGFHARALHRL